MAKKTLTAVIAVIATLSILLAVLTGCGSNKTAEERFEDWRSNSSVVTTKGSKMLQEKAISLLKENGIEVQDSYVSAHFMDGIPYISFTAIVKENEEKALKSYSVETDYDGPIASAFGFNSDEISVYGDMLYIDYYFEYGNYSLQGEEIVVTE